MLLLPRTKFCLVQGRQSAAQLGEYVSLAVSQEIVQACYGEQ